MSDIAGLAVTLDEREDPCMTLQMGCLITGEEGKLLYMDHVREVLEQKTDKLTLHVDETTRDIHAVPWWLDIWG